MYNKVLTGLLAGIFMFLVVLVAVAAYNLSANDTKVDLGLCETINANRDSLRGVLERAYELAKKSYPEGSLQRTNADAFYPDEISRLPRIDCNERVRQ